MLRFIQTHQCDSYDSSLVQQEFEHIDFTYTEYVLLGYGRYIIRILWAISGHVGLNVEMLMFLSRCHCVKSSAHQGMLHVIPYEM